MDAGTLEFLQQYKYWLLFLVVFVEQIGLPTPSTPFLLAAGAFVRTGSMSWGMVLVASMSATLISDIAWYSAGRVKGAKILGLLCRISLEPDSCVSRTKTFFARHGVKALLAAKFVPGLNTVSPPLAGILNMSWPRFLFFDSLGALVWVGAFLGLGFAFGHQLEDLLIHASRLGSGLGIALAAGLAVYVGLKYWQRRQFIRMLRVQRITPEELKIKIDGGEDLLTVDLRQRVDFMADPISLPGSFHLPLEELATRYREIPSDREIILVCT